MREVGLRRMTKTPAIGFARSAAAWTASPAWTASSPPLFLWGRSPYGDRLRAGTRRSYAVGIFRLLCQPLPCSAYAVVFAPHTLGAPFPFPSGTPLAVLMVLRSLTWLHC